MVRNFELCIGLPFTFVRLFDEWLDVRCNQFDFLLCVMGDGLRCCNARKIQKPLGCHGPNLCLL